MRTCRWGYIAFSAISHNSMHIFFFSNFVIWWMYRPWPTRGTRTAYLHRVVVDNKVPRVLSMAFFLCPKKDVIVKPPELLVDADSSLRSITGLMTRLWSMCLLSGLRRTRAKWSEIDVYRWEEQNQKEFQINDAINEVNKFKTQADRPFALPS